MLAAKLARMFAVGDVELVCGQSVSLDGGGGRGRRADGPEPCDSAGQLEQRLYEAS